ncbi:MAG TPA: sigma factor [Verrucomicrobiae bacterium]
MGFASEFCTTHWSVVLSVARGDSPAAAAAALESICRAYWSPVYCFVRRRGYGPQDAEDLTQEFFAELLARGDFDGLDRSRGKFRSFLIACLTHFLAKDWRGRKALKRGGGRTIVPLDGAEAEDRYANEQATESDPALLFDRQWALAILEQALSALGAEQAAAGKGLQFEQLRAFLTLAPELSGYEEASRRLQTTPGAVAAAVHRLRQRYRDLVRESVAQTVATPIELEEEIRYLLEVLSR